MRVFRDLELVEHLGSGIPRILKAYDASVFEIRESYLRVIFPYREGFTADTESSEKSSEKILILMQNDSTISIKALAETLQMTTRGIEKQIAELKKQGLLMRIGGAKGGHWEVLNHDK